MIETKEFKNWHRIEVAKRLGELEEIEEKINEEMKKIKIEVKSEDGKWVEYNPDSGG